MRPWGSGESYTGLNGGEAHHAVKRPEHVFEGALQVGRPQEAKTNDSERAEQLEWEGLVSRHGCERAWGGSSEHEWSNRGVRQSLQK